MSGGFVKLYGSLLLGSSLMEEAVETRWLFICFACAADETGFVRCQTVGNAARLANLTHDQAATALAALSSPDPHSTTPDEDGRRIMAAVGGWRVVNHAKYREMRTERQKQGAERQRSWRERHVIPERADLLRRLVDRDGSVCGVCGKKVDFADAHVDHRTPRTLGGGDDFDNLQLAHPKCNRVKGNRYCNASNASETEVSASASLSVVSVGEGSGERDDDRGARLLHQSRVAKERKFYAAVSRLSELQPEKDPPDIARDLTGYTAKDGRKVKGVVRPEGLTDERLDKSLADAEWWIDDLTKPKEAHRGT